jgi:hypothetical protein
MTVVGRSATMSSSRVSLAGGSLSILIGSFELGVFGISLLEVSFVGDVLLE